MCLNVLKYAFPNLNKCPIYGIFREYASIQASVEEVQTIVALGAGTVTKRVYGDGRIERCDNVKDIKLYIEKIDEMIERKMQLFADEN